MVEGDRPSRRAIARTPSSAASPREISSRSTKRKLRAARRRSRGRKPPARSTYHVTVALSHPNTALIWTAGSPRCQRDHNTSTSCDVSRLYLRAMDPSGECVISHLLHSPVEITNGFYGSAARRSPFAAQRAWTIIFILERVRNADFGAMYRHVPRNTVIGSTFAARRAGMKLANNATIVSSTITATNDTGSVALTP